MWPVRCHPSERSTPTRLLRDPHEILGMPAPAPADLPALIDPYDGSTLSAEEMECADQAQIICLGPEVPAQSSSGGPLKIPVLQTSELTPFQVFALCLTALAIWPSSHPTQAMAAGCLIWIYALSQRK